MPLKTLGYSIIKLDRIEGPVVLQQWVSPDWLSSKRYTDLEFNIKVFTSIKTGIIPRLMDFESTRCYFFSIKDDVVLILFTNRSGRSSDMDRVWSRCNRMFSDHVDDYHLLDAKIRSWAVSQRTKLSRAKKNQILGNMASTNARTTS
ncbi:MAG: hypothetical protein ACTSP4_09725 [Candidatus Hodarchaeales archaeon]